MNQLARQSGAGSDDGDSTSRVGQLVDERYRLRRALGEGATGRVFLARDLARHGAPVAIKIAKAVFGQDARRLEQEARLALTIVHPNVCRALGFGRLPDGRPYLVMEALRGQPLSLRLKKEKRLGWKVSLSICSQILYGLHAVHQLGIVHRDVTPGNVYLEGAHNSGRPRVKLLDFGFAKPPPDLAMVVTRIGHTFGVPGYIAPELLAGQPADPRCDLFSVGVVLFQMLAGVMPFESAHPEQPRRRQHVVLKVRPLDAYVKGLPPQLCRIVETALAKEPERRFQNASAFLAAMEIVCADAVTSAAWLPVLDDSNSEGTSASKIRVPGTGGSGGS